MNSPKLAISSGHPYGKIKFMITADHLRAILQYDPDTGLFVWKTHYRRPDLIGKLAGSPTNTGYWAIAINNRKMLAHRLAWLYETGAFPAGHIDHKDGNKQNNRFNNLREVSRCGNLQNMRVATKASKSGFLGVSAHQGKWRVQIMVDGKRIRESGFNTPEEAHQRYIALKRIHHLTCTI
jgi:hypothetical protein